MLLFKKNNSYGFALVEVMVSAAILSAVTIALLSYAQKGLTLSNTSLRQAQANYLIEEGANAIKSFRNDSWDNISDLVLDTDYYFVISNGVWELSRTPSTINGIFTRRITFSEVLRDNSTNDIVATGGTVDSDARQVTITIFWSTSDGGTEEKTLSFYIFNIFN